MRSSAMGHPRPHSSRRVVWAMRDRASLVQGRKSPCQQSGLKNPLFPRPSTSQSMTKAWPRNTWYGASLFPVMKRSRNRRGSRRRLMRDIVQRTKQVVIHADEVQIGDALRHHAIERGEA